MFAMMSILVQPIPAPTPGKSPGVGTFIVIDEACDFGPKTVTSGVRVRIPAFFRFEIGQRVALIESGEEGKIIVRAQYATSEDHYQVRYEAGDGCCREVWWGQSALEPVDA